MLSSALLVVAAFGIGCYANPAGVAPAIDYGNANFYVDLVLFNVNRQLPDNISITEMPPGMEEPPFGANNCFFVGLDNGLKREGDATLVVEDDIAKFVCGFKLQEIGFVCDFKVGLDHGHGEGKTANVILDVGIILEMEHGQHPWITEWRVAQMDPIVVTVTGFFGLNWIIEDIANWIAANAQDSIEYVIEHQMRDLFQKKLDTIVIP